jgi:YHS domain-containing protein
MLTGSSRRTIMLAATALFISAAGPAFAYKSQSKAPLNLDDKAVALRGYDPVAYVTMSKPTPGLAALTATHEGATYQFSTAEHQAMFVKDPAKFAPQFGGYCAFAAAKGAKVDADPTIWNVTDGRLYVNFNADVGVKWNAEKATLISDANTKWPTLKDAPAK